MSFFIPSKINELNSMKKYPEKIFYRGNLDILKKRKVSIVGSRKPTKYSALFTNKISSELCKRGIVIVSGAAIGVDAIAHKATDITNTIAVVANGLNIKYPSINKKLIEEIENKGLVLSTYEDNEKPKNYTFVQRNELVVALGEILIVTHADEKSGTLSSINYALEMGKKVYTIPQRLDESLGTQKLVAKGLIEPIYNLDDFFNLFGKAEQKDELSLYLDTFPLYEDAIKKYGNRIFELELEGKIVVENGVIKPL